MGTIGTATTGQQYLRSVDVDKAVVGYAEEANIFKKYLSVTPTESRLVRWYKLTTPGFLTGVTTTGMTASPFANTPQLALPTAIEETVTRMETYVRDYFAETVFMSEEDIRDTDPDMLLLNLKQATMGVENQVDTRIYSVLSASAILSGDALAFTSGGWSYTTGGFLNPILDLLSGSVAIRKYSYDVSNLAVLVSPTAYKWLVNYLISVKGSSIPSFSSSLAQNGVLLELLGQKIVVSQNCSNAYAVQLVPQTCGTWKSFGNIRAEPVIEPLIGRKYRIKESGEILVTNPYAVHVIRTGIAA